MMGPEWVSVQALSLLGLLWFSVDVFGLKKNPVLVFYKTSIYGLISLNMITLPMKSFK